MGMAEARVYGTASEVLDHLLDGIDTRAPGMIVGTYITGSIALGDGRPGKSDIDLVMIRDSGASNESTMAALEPALADLQRTRPRPMIDGLVLDLHDLEAGPDRIEGERPVILDNVAQLSTDSSGRNPVTWQTLRQCGISWRGTPLDPDRLWHDPERLDAWTRGNLESYWRPWLASRSATVSLGGWPIEWGVLGVSRLHYTLATGCITSKHGAGEYALDTFPKRWHRIVRESLRVREGRRDERQFRNPFERRQHMREYVTMVIDDALALPQVDVSGDLSNS